MELCRFLSEDDASDFCHKDSLALSKGWELHGSPTDPFDTACGVMRCGGAVVADLAGSHHPEMKLAEQ